MTRWIEVVTGPLEQKKQYRDLMKRMKALPAGYDEAAEAMHRYILHAGGISKGDVLVAALTDLVELFEQAAADRTPIGSIVGDDTIAFAEDFLANYADGSWLHKERARFSDAIDRAARTTEDGS